MDETNLPKIFHLGFTPERWSKLETLRAMLNAPLPTTPDVYQGLDASLGHLRKYSVFARLADRVVADLPKDHEELERTGGSNNCYSEEYGVLIEAMVCELYSTLDGLRSFLCGVWPKMQGLQNKSNNKLFRKAKECAYGADFPEPIRALLAEAFDTWFIRLRDLRQQITHSTGGFFSYNHKNKTVSYFWNKTGVSQPPIIEDIMLVVAGFETSIRSLLEKIAIFFLEQISAQPRLYVCGSYLARIYIRMVAFELNLSFNSGHCASWDWFEKETQFTCPLACRCAAYSRKWPGGYAAAVAPRPVAGLSDDE